jgi:hypothetical protein
MRYYTRVRLAVNTALPTLRATQATNLALLISAILIKRTLCLSELARAYPRSDQRRVPAPKHDLLHRLKRLWRFLNNDRLDPLALQLAMLPFTIAHLGHPRWLALAIDWTMFDTVLPTGRRIRYQVLRIAIPRRGRAIPVLQLAYDRDHLPGTNSQNQLEEAALGAVIAMLPPHVRPVVLADRGFARASFLQWLQQHQVDYVIRLDKGACVTECDGRRWKLGDDGLPFGACRWAAQVRYGLYHGRPRDLTINLALCWQTNARRMQHPRAVPPSEPWYLATSLATAKQAVAWYWQRGWIEQSFKDSKSRFGLKRVQVQCPRRLTRLLMALTIALTWLSLLGLPERGVQPQGWHAAVAQRGRASMISLALALLDHVGDLPEACLPLSAGGGYA